MDCCNHDHDHDHDHGADDRPVAPVGLSVAHADTASRSLSDALGWSFKLLSIIMVLVVGAFCFTGVVQIKNNEVGLIKVFGDVVTVAKPGLAITWPYPIGEIEVVSTKPQNLVIEDFWMLESPEERLNPKLADRRPRGDGLRPGWDGALFTGDKSLIHMKVVCTFSVDADKVTDFKKNVLPKYIFKDVSTHEDLVVEPVRSVVCQAMIHTAAQWTADRIKNQPGDFLAEVKGQTQAGLNDLQAGLKLSSITIPTEGLTLPLIVRPMYDEAQRARSQKESTISEAIKDANNMLNSAAGSAARRALVGDHVVYASLSATQPMIEGEDYDLIGQYNEARNTAELARTSGNKDQEAASLAKAEKILEKIDRVLVSSATVGEANRIINNAAIYATQLRQKLEGRTQKFEELMAQYLRNPDFTLESLWLEKRRDLLDDPTILKYYLNTSGGKTVITINHDPAMMQDIQKILTAKPAEPSSGALVPPPPPPSMGGP